LIKLLPVLAGHYYAQGYAHGHGMVAACLCWLSWRFWLVGLILPLPNIQVLAVMQNQPR